MNKKLLVNTAMTWGLVLAVGFVVNHFAFKFLGDQSKGFEGYVQNLITILVLVFSAQYFKNKIDDADPFTYGNSFKLGFLTFVFGGILFSLFNIINITVIDPGYMERLIVESEEAMLTMGFSDDMVEQQMAMQKKMMTPAFVTLSQFFGLLIYGTLFTLITSIFTQKKNNNSFEQTVESVSEENNTEDKWTYQ